mmetsp:Transcript_27329/g.89231  ORF Transcript_27329/g.89231 Transcript_27329/m.89231 type:complete len:324 (-) Transcript_27329:48-1019(-)
MQIMTKIEQEWSGTVRSYASQTLKALEKNSRRTWTPPSGQTSSPRLAYMMLPCSHPSSMTPAIRKAMISRRSTSNEIEEGANMADGANLKSLNSEMDNVHRDLTAFEDFLKSRQACEIDADRCIEACDAFIVLQNAGPIKAIKEFFGSDEVDIFVLVYSGHATEEGALCFAEHLITFEQVLGMWQQARAKNSNTEARLLLFLDCPRSGKWVKALEGVPMAAAFASGMMVQASCGAMQDSWSSPEEGGNFTRWFTSQQEHGKSPWTIEVGEVKPAGQASLPHEEQLPCMSCKFDLFSSRRAIMCVGGEEDVPNISLFGESWFTS